MLVTYDNQFYKGNAAIVQHHIGKGSVAYIGVDTDDSRLEKDLLHRIYNNAGAETEEHPEGVYVYRRDGFYAAINYSS